MRREQVRAVALSVVMVVSVVAMSATFAGSVAAQGDTITVDSVEEFRTNVSGSGTATSGDTIRVSGGDYSLDSNVDISVQNLTIRPVENEAPTFDVASAGLDPVFTVSADDVRIEGLTFTDSSGDAPRVIRVSDQTADVEIVDNDITRDNDGNSVVSVGGDSPTIEDNSVTGGPIAVTSSGDITIRGNTVSGTNPADGHGIFLTGSAGAVVIEENDLSGFDAAGDETSDLLVSSAVSSLNGESTDRDGVLSVLDDNTGVDSIQYTAAELTATTEGDTIGDAVARSSSGFTILAQPGTYDESVTIDTQDVTLESTAGPDSTTLRLDEDSSDAVVDVEASGVTVDGFSIERLNGQAYSQGIAVRATDGVTVSDNVITETGGTQPQQGILLTDNRGDQDANTNANVTGNEVTGFDHGIAVSTQDTTAGGISGAEITGNTLEDNVIGVKFSDFTDTGETINADVSGNDIVNNDDGVRVLGDAAGPAGTDPDGVVALDSVTVTENDLSGNSNTGITNNGTGDAIDATDNWWGDAKPNFTAQVDGLDNVEVAPWLDGPDGEATGVYNVDQGTYSRTIQDAVDAANADETIEVPAGTYNESVTVDTSGLTLESTAGADSTTLRLDEDSTDAVIDIEASSVTVDGFSIERRNGQAYSQGIAIRATDGVTVSNNVITETGGTQPQQGILLTDNRGDQDANTNADITGNEVTGFDHGIAVSTQDETAGGISGAEITGNTLEDNVIGVKLSDFYDTNEPVSADISGNDIVNNDDGVRVLGDAEGPAGTNPDDAVELGSVTVNENDLSGNSNSGVTNDGDGSVDATNNWWGAATGPSGDGPGTGASVSGDVDFDPFYTNAAQTSLSDAVGSGSVDQDGTARVDLRSQSQTVREVEVSGAGGAGSVIVVESDSPTGDAPDPTGEGNEPEGTEVTDVVTYTDISADGSVTESVTVSITVNGSNVDDPDAARILHYVNGEWTERDTSAEQLDDGDVRLRATVTELSPFAVAEVAADDTDETDGDDGGDGSSGGNAGAVVAGTDSVTQTVRTGPIQEVTTTFDRDTTGFVATSAVDGLPSGAPSTPGTLIAAVDITPPDDVADRPGTVELTVSRSALADADAAPSDLRIVRYDEADGEIDRLDTEVVSEGDETVVVAADTPGFSVFGVVADVDDEVTAEPTATPTATATPEPTETSTATDTPEPASTPTATDTPEPTDGDGPGFGAAVAVLALLSAALLAVRRD